MDKKTFTLRIDTETLDKLHVVSAYENRSANGQIMALIQGCIKQYEDQHGVITIGKKQREK